MAGLGAEVNAIFQAAVAELYDSECSVEREGAETKNNRFGYSRSDSTVYTNVPCLVQHNVANYGSRGLAYADRLAGRALCLITIPRTYTVLDRDRIRVEGGDTYDVVGPPHLDGPDDPALSIPAGAVAPVVTNPSVP